MSFDRRRFARVRHKSKFIRESNEFHQNFTASTISQTTGKILENRRSEKQETRAEEFVLYLTV